MLADVKQTTIGPLIRATIAPGSARLHRRVRHLRPAGRVGLRPPARSAMRRGEYARDDDGDGFCEVHVNTLEGFWSLLRSWLRPHRGVSQEKLPLYLGFFEFVHNVRRRGKALLGPCRPPGRVSDAHHPETRQEPQKNARRTGAQRARELSPGRHPFPGGVSEAVDLILDLEGGSGGTRVREQEGLHGVRARSDRSVLGERARHECTVGRYHA